MEEAEELHEQVSKEEWERDPELLIELILIKFKRNKLEEAEKSFETLAEKGAYTEDIEFSTQFLKMGGMIKEKLNKTQESKLYQQQACLLQQRVNQGHSPLSLSFILGEIKMTLEAWPEAANFFDQARMFYETHGRKVPPILLTYLNVVQSKKDTPD
jgi:hypothetical protein